MLVNLSFLSWAHIEIIPKNSIAMIEFIFLFVEIALANSRIFFANCVSMLRTEGFLL